MRQMQKIWRDRHACDVLKEMRKMNETRNYSQLDSHIEELINMSITMLKALNKK